MKHFQEQVAGTCLKNSNWFEFVGLVTGTKVGPLQLDFEAKMASLHDATCPCDLLQGLVAETSPLMCADLMYLTNYFYCIYNHGQKQLRNSPTKTCFFKRVSFSISNFDISTPSPIPANSHALGVSLTPVGVKTSISRRLTLTGQFLTPD